MVFNIFRYKLLVVGGGTGGSAVAAKMASVLGKGNVMILDAADVPNCILTSLNKRLLNFALILTETLLSTNVHNDWRWNEETQRFILSDGRCYTERRPFAEGRSGEY